MKKVLRTLGFTAVGEWFIFLFIVAVDLRWLNNDMGPIQCGSQVEIPKVWGMGTKEK